MIFNLRYLLFIKANDLDYPLLSDRCTAMFSD